MNKSKLKIIRDIEAQVPQEWRDSLIAEEYVAPDVRDEVIAQLAEYPEAIAGLSGDDKADAERDFRRLTNLYNAGYYDAKQQVVDQDLAAKIEDFVDKGIKEAIKDGRLPKPKDDKELKDYVTKIHRNEKRKEKSSLRAKQSAKRGGT